MTQPDPSWRASLSLTPADPHSVPSQSVEQRARLVSQLNNALQAVFRSNSLELSRVDVTFPESS